MVIGYRWSPNCYDLRVSVSLLKYMPHALLVFEKLVEIYFKTYIHGESNLLRKWFSTVPKFL